MDTIEVPGASLMAESVGRGDPLVLLHGFGDDRHSWDTLVTALSPEREVIRYDLRGFGQSSIAARLPYRHAADLKALLDAFHLECCDLLGISLGGSIALNFALDHPQRVRRLVLINPALTGWDWSEDWRSRWLEIKRTARACGVEAAKALWWRHPLFDTARAIPAAAQQLRTRIARYAGTQWLYDDEEPALPDVDRLPALSVRTLLLTGTEDQPDFRLIADLIEGAASAVKRVDLQGSGHLLTLEQPLQVLARVREFLE
jgi:2-succinyl-6-hydroxy-2,4-cyclohexadiene-1-carboxylate synthase